VPRAWRAQDKYFACAGLFGDWYERSGGDALVEWKPPAAPGERWTLTPVHDDADGVARVPSPEAIVDFLLQVCTHREERESVSAHMCMHSAGGVARAESAQFRARVQVREVQRWCALPSLPLSRSALVSHLRSRGRHQRVAEAASNARSKEQNSKL
jgi:hypothetical protein